MKQRKEVREKQLQKNIMEFMRLKTPVTSVVLGEAGGGGAF